MAETVDILIPCHPLTDLMILQCQRTNGHEDIRRYFGPQWAVEPGIMIFTPWYTRDIKEH